MKLWSDSVCWVCARGFGLCAWLASGAHFNFAETLAVLASGSIEMAITYAICYMISQVLGGNLDTDILGGVGMSLLTRPEGTSSSGEAVAVAVVYLLAALLCLS